MPNIPWQERPEGNNEVMWRYSENPVIDRDAIPSSNSIFNSAVVPFEGGFAGVFRCDTKARTMRLNAGFSNDGINWDINHDTIQFIKESEELADFEYGYDPRVCKIDDKYWVTWCNGYKGQPTIGIAWTEDFKSFHQQENAYLPFNRNGVMFPRKINGEYVMLSRPSDSGHTPFGDIYISQSKDMVYWGKHRHVMAPAPFNISAWQCTKIGAGPIPIETSEGWLVIYHGVLNSCNGFVYSAGIALLDLDEPWKVIARADDYILNPRTIYECVGDVPTVVFPCAALVDSDSGKLAMYYGCADTVTGMAFAYVDELLQFVKEKNFIQS